MSTHGRQLRLHAAGKMIFSSMLLFDPLCVCISAHRAHTAADERIWIGNFFFSFLLLSFLSNHQNCRVLRYKNISFLYFFFSALFLFLVNENFCQFFWNFRQFKALLLSHINWTHTTETEWRKWQKKIFFFSFILHSDSRFVRNSNTIKVRNI